MELKIKVVDSRKEKKIEDLKSRRTARRQLTPSAAVDKLASVPNRTSNINGKTKYRIPEDSRR